MIEKENLDWEHVIDTNAFNGNAATLYKVREIPFNVITDPNRKMIAINLTAKELSKKLDSIFGVELLRKTPKSSATEQKSLNP